MRPRSPERARALERRRRYLERRRAAEDPDAPRSAESSAAKQPKINLYGCAAAVLLTSLSAAAFIIWAVLLPNPPAESDAPVLNPANDLHNAPDNPAAQTQERSLLIALPSAEADADGGTWSTKRRQEKIPEGNANRLKLVAEVWMSAMAEAGGIVPSTELLSAYIDAENQAYLNFTDGFAESLNKGLTRELEIVISLAKTIRENLPTTRRAALLVEGKELDPNASQLRLSSPIDLVFYAELDDEL